MIFASDLDRTLIYSDKFLKDFSGEVIAAEHGKYFSYMTKQAVTLLKQIAEKLIFVPCTTRTIEQYRRIQFFHEEVKPRYAVVSNGANILIDGVLDTKHQKTIASSLNNCLASEDILKEFGKLTCGGWSQPIRCADGVLYYCIIERDRMPRSELISFGYWLIEKQWEMSIQGRKLYLVPKVINKWAALKRVADITGEEKIIGAGDSLLDLPLLRGANYGIIPAHGELCEQFGDTDVFHSTKSTGILAGEEILRTVVQWT